MGSGTGPDDRFGSKNEPALAGGCGGEVGRIASAQ